MNERYNKLKKIITDEGLISRLFEEKNPIVNELYITEGMIENRKDRLTRCNEDYKENELKRKKLFVRKEYKKTKAGIEENINRIEKEIQELEKKEEELKLKVLDIDEKLRKLGVSDVNDYSQTVPFSLTNDGFIYINSNDLDNIVPTQKKDIGDEETVLVHCTGLFPKGHRILTSKEGHKLDRSGAVEITYKGFTRTIPSVSTRNTVHFTENNVVGDHMYGKFPPDYIIVEPIKYHKEEIINDEPSDTWIRGSVKLSNEAIIMVEKSKIDKLPEDLKKEYTIIIFDGDRGKSVNNLLKQLGYPILDIDLGSASHAYSIDSHLEGSIKTRNQMISFFKEKIIDSYDVSLDKEDVILLYDLFRKGDCLYNFMIPRSNAFLNKGVTMKLCVDKGIDFELFKFFINFGIIKQGDGYVTRSYDEMVDLFETIEDDKFDENVFNAIIKQTGILNIQGLLEKDSIEEDTIVKKEELLNMPFSEINNFKHLEYAAAMQQYIKDTLGSIMQNPTISFDSKGINILFWKKEDEENEFFQSDYNIREYTVLENIGVKLLLHIECEELLCSGIFEVVDTYVSKVKQNTNINKLS